MRILSFILLNIIVASANASLIMEEYSNITPDTIGGWEMTDFSYSGTANGGSVTSISSPIAGEILFKDRNEDFVSLKNYSDTDKRWWNNDEVMGYDIYTTDLHLVTLLLPENTRAFSFNVGAKLRGSGDNAWLTAVADDGNGIMDKQFFAVNRNNTPGFGIYSTIGANGACSSIASVTIDPDFWGFGNFSINQGACTTTSVPAPTTFIMLMIGLGALILVNRKTV